MGIIIALYSKLGDGQNQYFLVGGIVVLMLGIYRLSRNIPSRNDEDSDSNINLKE